MFSPQPCIHGQTASRTHPAYLRNRSRAYVPHKHRSHIRLPLRSRYSLKCAEPWREPVIPVLFAEKTVHSRTAKPLLVLLTAVFACLCFALPFAGKKSIENQEDDGEVSEEIIIEETEASSELTANNIISRNILPYAGHLRSLGKLQTVLEDELSAYEGDWSLYLKRLDDGETVIINSHQMPSASLIKLFTAGRYEQAVLNNEISSSYISEHYLQNMITYSGNDAWVNLETYIGHGSYRNGYTSVTEFAASIGCEDTGRLTGSAHPWDDDADNLTSVISTGYVLEQIYEGEYVSKEASEKILSYMKDQYYKHKIPAGVPDGIVTANKTGELSNVQNDAAIIYGENCTYILVIMSHNGPAESGSWQIIAGISAEIYDYLN